MLRATPGWRRTRPRRSSVSTIWCTEGGLTPEMALHVGLGRGTAMDAGVGVNEGQVLTLRVGEPCRGHRHTIDSSAPLATERHDDHTLPGRPERRRALRAPDPAARRA